MLDWILFLPNFTVKLSKEQIALQSMKLYHELRSNKEIVLMLSPIHRKITTVSQSPILDFLIRSVKDRFCEGSQRAVEFSQLYPSAMDLRDTGMSEMLQMYCKNLPTPRLDS